MARPREFEPEEALEKAMLQFWASGYHDTSIRDLTARTGVNQYGLYGTFHSKHGLYMAALDRYRNTVTRDVLSALRAPGSVVEAVRSAYAVLIDRMRTADGPVGCLMANAAIEVAPEDAEIADKVGEHMSLLRNAFGSRLAEGVRDGTIPADCDLKALSEFLATTAYSLGFLLRAGCDDAYLRRHVDMALRTMI